MPELPEVETVRAGLEPVVNGRTITHVDVLHPRSVRAHPGPPAHFEDVLVDREFGAPRRRGKYLWLPLSDGDAVVAHLGMSGQFRINSAADPRHPHTRVVLGLDDGQELRFVDQRMFGGLALSAGGAELPAEVAHIARDPFDPEFDLAATARRLRQRRSSLKRTLLDQRLVSGIGNIYADETLWRSRLHPETPTQRLSTARARQVLITASEVMSEALAQGGTSFDALYVNVNGTSGYFARDLDAYGRDGLPCRRCGTAMVREQFMNRSSVRCPRCQPAPRRARRDAGEPRSSLHTTRGSARL